MKLFPTIILVPVLGLSGCLTINTNPVRSVPVAPSTDNRVVRSVQATTPYLRSSSALACVGLLASTQNRTSRTKYANNLYVVAQAVRSFTGTTPASVTDFEKGIKAFLPAESKDIDMSIFIGSVVALYGSAKPSITASAGDYLAALEQIALGIEDAARPWITP